MVCWCLIHRLNRPSSTISWGKHLFLLYCHSERNQRCIGAGGKLLRHQYNLKNDEHFKNTVIYHLNCQDCDMKYIGQTGRSFRMSFREHLCDYKYRTGNSKFVQHFHDYNNSFGPTDTVMDLLHVIKKGTMMDTLVRYHIYRFTSLGTQINDRNTAS